MPWLFGAAFPLALGALAWLCRPYRDPTTSERGWRVIWGGIEDLSTWRRLSQ